MESSFRIVLLVVFCCFGGVKAEEGKEEDVGIRLSPALFITWSIITGILIAIIIVLALLRHVARKPLLQKISNLEKIIEKQSNERILAVAAKQPCNQGIMVNEVSPATVTPVSGTPKNGTPKKKQKSRERKQKSMEASVEVCSCRKKKKSKSASLSEEFPTSSIATYKDTLELLAEEKTRQEEKREELPKDSIKKMISKNGSVKKPKKKKSAISKKTRTATEGASTAEENSNPQVSTLDSIATAEVRIPSEKAYK